MKLKDMFEMDGFLRITKVYKDGTEVIHYGGERGENDDKGKNLIVLVPRRNLLSMVYLRGRESDPITTLRAGVGGAIDPQGQYPREVTKDQAQLYSSLLSVPTSYTVDNTIPACTFIADIPEDQAVGQLITEAGLFTQSGVMFNIKTFPGVPKTSQFSLHFEWTIYFG